MPHSNNNLKNAETWLETCHFCHEPLILGQKLVGSLEKKVAYHEHCYESMVLNFGTEAQRQDYFKMREET